MLKNYYWFTRLLNTSSADIIAVIEENLWSSSKLLRTSSTKIGVIIALLDGMTYPELRLTMWAIKYCSEIIQFDYLKKVNVTKFHTIRRNADDKRWPIAIFICLNASSLFTVIKPFCASNHNFYPYSMGVLKIKHNHQKVRNELWKNYLLAVSSQQAFF